MKKLLIAILGIAGLTAIVHAQSYLVNAVPYTIRTPGYYYLDRDIFSTANAQIRIYSDNVVLDLGGHTLQVASTDACVHIPGQKNVTVKNGSLINTAGGCLHLEGAECVLEALVAVCSSQCALFDEGGTNNLIKDSVFVSGNPASFEGPSGSHGPGFNTIVLLGASDVVEHNIITASYRYGGAIGSAVIGADPSTAGNAIRNNVIHGQPAVTDGLHDFDIWSGNLFPGGTP